MPQRVDQICIPGAPPGTRFIAAIGCPLSPMAAARIHRWDYHQNSHSRTGRKRQRVKAGCNTFTGIYSQENGFTIELGATSMAFCGEGALDQ